VKTASKANVFGGAVVGRRRGVVTGDDVLALQAADWS